MMSTFEETPNYEAQAERSTSFQVAAFAVEHCVDNDARELVNWDVRDVDTHNGTVRSDEHGVVSVSKYGTLPTHAEALNVVFNG